MSAFVATWRAPTATMRAPRASQRRAGTDLRESAERSGPHEQAKLPEKVNLATLAEVQDAWGIAGSLAEQRMTTDTPSLWAGDMFDRQVSSSDEKMAVLSTCTRSSLVFCVPHCALFRAHGTAVVKASARAAAEDYFALPPLTAENLECQPTWIMHLNVLNQTDVWSAAVPEPVIPAMIPEDLRPAACLLTLKHPFEKLIAKLNSVAMPEEGSGAANSRTGRRNHIKIDFASALVHHLFPRLRPDDEEYQRMVRDLAGTKRKLTDCPDEVLAAVSVLDKDNAETFQGLATRFRAFGCLREFLRLSWGVNSELFFVSIFGHIQGLWRPRKVRGSLKAPALHPLPVVADQVQKLLQRQRRLVKEAAAEAVAGVFLAGQAGFARAVVRGGGQAESLVPMAQACKGLADVVHGPSAGEPEEGQEPLQGGLAVFAQVAFVACWVLPADVSRLVRGGRVGYVCFGGDMAGPHGNDAGAAREPETGRASNDLARVVKSVQELLPEAGGHGLECALAAVQVAGERAEHGAQKSAQGSGPHEQAEAEGSPDAVRVLRGEGELDVAGCGHGHALCERAPVVEVAYRAVEDEAGIAIVCEHDVELAYGGACRPVQAGRGFVAVERPDEPALYFFGEQALEQFWIVFRTLPVTLAVQQGWGSKAPVGEQLQEVQAERLARVDGQAGGVVAVGVQVRGHFVGQVLAAGPGLRRRKPLGGHAGAGAVRALQCEVAEWLLCVAFAFEHVDTMRAGGMGACSGKVRAGSAVRGEQPGAVTVQTMRAESNGRHMSARGLQCVNESGIEPDGAGGMCLQEEVAAGSIGCMQEGEA
ncbi:cyp6, partial [Symbiodinium sp. CCMP2456]